MKKAVGQRTVGILGCGALGEQIAHGIRDGLAGPYQLTGVHDLWAPDQAEALAGETGAACCDRLVDLLHLKCDYIVEAANADALQCCAAPCLASGSHLVALSSGAFADAEFRERIGRMALEAHRTVHIPSGGLGAFDLAQAAAIAGPLVVAMTTEKPPRALAGAPALAGRLPSATEREIVFSGSAREAVAGYPQNVNVVASLSLATVGIDAVTMAVCSDPALTGNKHTFTLVGAFGRARLEIEARPLASNPKSSALAAYSVLALLKKLASPIQIG